MVATGQRRGGRGAPRRRLSRSADFDRVFRNGRSFATRHLVLHAFRRPETNSLESEAPPRLGVSVGRRVGGAVERNRVKRMLREAFREVVPSLPRAHDFVLVARSGAAELAEAGGEPAFEQSLRELVAQAGL